MLVPITVPTLISLGWKVNVMHHLFKINTVLATIACTCVTGSVFAAEVNTCSTNSQSTYFCPVALDNTKATTVKSPSENLFSSLDTEVSQPEEKEEYTKITRLQPSPDFDATQVILMLLGIVFITVILQKNHHGTDSKSTECGFTNQTNSRLHKKLLTSVQSPEIAKRLFLNTQYKYPERSVNWLLEKTIFDLERDRRAY